MLNQCWASITDGGPTLNQHQIYVSCLLGHHCGLLHLSHLYDWLIQVAFTAQTVQKLMRKLNELTTV